MTSHELANNLLANPDRPVVVYVGPRDFVSGSGYAGVSEWINVDLLAKFDGDDVGSIVSKGLGYNESLGYVPVVEINTRDLED